MAAEDFIFGKPFPESFLLALERLNTGIGQMSPPVKHEEGLVVEDSVSGARGVGAIGMIFLAVSSSYPREMLLPANRTASSLEEARLNNLSITFKEGA